MLTPNHCNCNSSDFYNRMVRVIKKRKPSQIIATTYNLETHLQNWKDPFGDKPLPPIANMNPSQLFLYYLNRTDSTIIINWASHTTSSLKTIRQIRLLNQLMPNIRFLYHPYNHTKIVYFKYNNGCRLWNGSSNITGGHDNTQFYDNMTEVMRTCDIRNTKALLALLAKESIETHNIVLQRMLKHG